LITGRQLVSVEASGAVTKEIVMAPSRASATLAIAIAVAGTVLTARAAIPMAHADPDPFADPRINIYNTVDKDLGNGGCNIGENRPLEDAAQAYAASENPADGRPANYEGKTAAFLGSGDPQPAAINSAYRNGAGAVIQQCKSNGFTQYGVGFLRKDHGNGPVDVVTIVFGAPTPVPPKPDPVLTPIPGAPLPPVTTPAPVTTPVQVTTPVNPPAPPALTATVTSDVDLYDKINVPDGAGKKIGILRKNTVVKVTAPCPSDDWCVLQDPAGAAWGSSFHNN
jgi:hypothetical protein